MTLRIDEEYELSECAEKAFRFHYPDSLTPKHPLFERRMLELQIALIECHRHTMFRSDQRRALSTIKQIKKRMKECLD